MDPGAKIPWQVKCSIAVINAMTTINHVLVTICGPARDESEGYDSEELL